MSRTSILALLIPVIFGALLLWHSSAVKRYGAEQYALGVADQELAGLAAQKRWRIEVGKDAEKLKEKHDEELRRVASAADALRLRGPGAAACVNPSVASAPARGHQPAVAAGDAALGDLPGEQWEPLVGLPFARTIAFAESHDELLTEVIGWRGMWRALVNATDSPEQRSED